jgi:hypothetical protein
VKHRNHIVTLSFLVTLVAAACSGSPTTIDGEEPPTTVASRPTTTAKPGGTTTTTSPVRPVTPTAPPSVPTQVTGAGTTLGSTNYPVPANAIVVATTGNDGNPGTSAAPVRSLGRAVAIAPSGATIVLRAGTYHESVMIPSGKTLTVQNWPAEVVWFDGSEPISGWVADGARWRKDGWTATFDHSPTYTRGAPDNTAASWTVLNPSYPMAAHPDQVWIDGQAQAQVASASQVGAGTFFKDDGASRLYLGTNPSGHDVRGATLVKALSIRGAGSTVRGIGFRRYSPSVPDMGAITAEAPNITLEHLVVTDMATTGVSVLASNGTLRNLDVSRAGMLGIHANYADGIRLQGVIAQRNNAERFNNSPVSGGFKVTRTRGVTVSGSVFSNNQGPGVWVDESVYDTKITGSDMVGNSGHGTSLELSAKALFANNVVGSNGGYGLKINNTSDVTVVNNSFLAGSNRPVTIAQDDRRAANRSTPGHDPRQPFPDPTMTWIIGPVLLQSNVITAPTAGNCVVCVEDFSKQFTAEQLGVSMPGNLYHRVSATTPSRLVVWSRGAATAVAYNDLVTFQSGTGQEASGRLVASGSVADATGRTTATATAFDGSAPALPSSIAGVIGQPAGTRHFGAFR